MEADAIEFMKELEARIGGKPGWRTFATWYGTSRGLKREYGVFLCRIEDRLYLEDFDRVPTFLGIPMKSRKNAEKYERYSCFIPISDIVSIKRVSKKKAEDIIRRADKTVLDEVGPMARALSPIVTQLKLKSGECVYFELIDHKDFLKMLNKENI